MLLVLASVSVLFSHSLCPPFGKELLIRLTVYFLCIVSICNFGCFPFRFRRWGCGSDCASSWSLLIFYCLEHSSVLIFEPRCEKTRSDTYRAVQPLKMAGGLKFRILEVEGLYYPCSENKGADQLRGYRETDLRLCFRICKKPVFSYRGSIHFQFTFGFDSVYIVVAGWGNLRQIDIFFFFSFFFFFFFYKNVNMNMSYSYPSTKQVARMATIAHLRASKSLA